VLAVGILNKSNMIQVLEMSHNEKVEVYQLIEKDKLIEMLIEANNVISKLTTNKSVVYTSNDSCKCLSSQCYLINGSYVCSTCNRPIVQ